MTVGAHHGATCGSDQSEVPAGIAIDSQREGCLRPCLEVRHLRLCHDNLACFKDGFDDSGSFLNIGGHHFYIAKPFPEEVTDVLDPLCDVGSSCSESNNFGAMVKVMALGDEEGGDPPCTRRPPLKRLLPQEQVAPLLEKDTSDIAVVDLHAPLDHVVDPVQVAEALEQTRIVLLSKVAEDIDARRRMSSTLHEFYDV
jgi:hypothetical protein